jgi:hypothetical protein
MIAVLCSARERYLNKTAAVQARISPWLPLFDNWSEHSQRSSVNTPAGVRYHAIGRTLYSLWCLR